MDEPPRSEPFDIGASPKALTIHLALLEYPILADRIRERMREVLFGRGRLDPDLFEQEVRRKAIESQQREGVHLPLFEESEQLWQRRLGRIREILTDYYFGTHMRQGDFLALVEEQLEDRRPSPAGVRAVFNPELAPWKMLFEQARMIEGLPPAEQQEMGHHLREIMVVLTKGMLSDQLSFLGIAKRALSIRDMEWIYARRIGRGRIGGKAGGMLLARAILHRAEPTDPIDFREIVTIPESNFVGSDVHYDFLDHNRLSEMVNYKYRPIEDLRESYPRFIEQSVAGRLPEAVRKALREKLALLGRVPLIVRSSSLLEDNFGVAFAGKYESFFLPNQGSTDENLEELVVAMKRIYASVLSPDAVLYRQQKELIDYDERMALLIQPVQGHRYRDSFFPAVAGVGFSHNPITWNPRIDRSQGFLRLVAGLGTRAVDRLDDDYALMVALSHPTLQPTKNTRERIQYAQKCMDVINLRDNRFETRPAAEVLDAAYPPLRHIAAMEQQGELHPLLVAGPGSIDGRVVLTFDGLLGNRKFTDAMRAMLRKLEHHYRRPVDVEFTVEFDPTSPVGFRIQLLQCRQQSRRVEQDVALPAKVAPADLVLSSRRMVANGHLPAVRYVVWVDPERYQELADRSVKARLARLVGELNARLDEECFILVGPGRWGSSNLDLGVPVRYGDIYNARLLVEVALPFEDHPPEASYGTHFFLDLIESDTLPLPIYPGEADAFVNYAFFRSAPNRLEQLLPGWGAYAPYLKLIDVPAATGGRVLEVIMNGQQERAMAFLRTPTG